MEKRQYHREMEKEIQRIPSGSIPKLLLHSCCGPCSSAVLEQLVPYFEIILFYYNPNIAPEYHDSEFWDAVRGAEHTPEMGERCERCIAQRMTEAVQAAIMNGCDYVTTTLTVSPHKNALFINECGERLTAGKPVRYLPSDFKKKGGYARSVALSAEYHLYRQDYCGCPMSLQEAIERRNKNNR